VKQCNLCGAYKDDSQFARRSDGRADGYQAHCLDCQAEKNRQFYAANQERIKARALARKHAIRDGTYREGANPQQGRQKRRPELPPPQKPRQLVGFSVDENEYRFLEAEGARRGIKMGDILRELIRAAMAAERAERRQLHGNDANDGG
jgi:hypothetical protein